MRRLHVTTPVVWSLSAAVGFAVVTHLGCNRERPPVAQAPLPTGTAAPAGDEQKAAAGTTAPGSSGPGSQPQPEAGTTGDMPVLETHAKGELHLFLPYRGKVSGHNVDAIQSYLVVVPRSFDQQTRHETFVTLLVRKGDSKVYGPDGVPLATSLQAGANGAWLILRDASTQDKSIQLLGFQESLASVLDAVPGREIFRLNFDVTLTEDTIVRLDAGSGKTKTEKRPVKPKPDAETAGPSAASGSPPSTPPTEPGAVAVRRDMTNSARAMLDLRTLGSIPGPAAVSDLAIKDGVLYIGRGEEQRIDLFDVRDPGNVRPLGSFELGRRVANQKKRGRYLESSIDRIELRPPYAFVLNSGWKATDDVLVLNIPKAGKPTPAATYKSGSEPVDIRMAGNLAYLLTRQGLQVLDISNPLDPKRLRIEKLSPGSSEEVDVFGMALTAAGTYVSGYGSAPYLFRIPRQTGAPEKISLEQGMVAMTLGESEGHLFVAKADLSSRSAIGLQVYSADSKGALRLQRTLPLGRHATPAKLTVRDGRLYVLLRHYPPDLPDKEIGNFDTLRVYDMGNPPEWTLVDAYANEAKCPGSALAMEGRRVYVGMDRGCGVVILDRG